MKEGRVSFRELLPLIGLVIFCAVIVLVLIFGKRDPGGARQVSYLQYFDTVSTLYDYSGGSAEEFAERSARVEAMLKHYHTLFDIYNEYEGISNLATVNRRAGEAVSVDGDIIDFLIYAKEIYTLTDGAVNVAMGSVLSIWSEYREEGIAIPDPALLQAAAEHTDLDMLTVDREGSSVTLTDSEMLLDVGAVAKGYVAEKIAQYLKEDGADGYVLDLGGNLRVIGTKPDGSGWRTGVRDPRGEGYVYYMDIKDTSVVTSGDYERYYTVDGVRYHHIIDGETLMPSRKFSSVTVVCADSALADALSTALFLMDMDKGLALVSELEGVEALWISPDGTLTESDGLQGEREN